MRLGDNISMVFRPILLFWLKTIKLSIFRFPFMYKSNFGSFSLSDHIQHRSYSGYRNSTLAFSFLKQCCCFLLIRALGKKKATCPLLETWGISLQDMEPLTRSYICCTGSCRRERLSVRNINQGCESVVMDSDEGLFWSPTWPSNRRWVELGLTMQCKNVPNSPCLVPVVVWTK